MARTTVLIRAFNEEKHLGALLAALALQEDRDFEVLLVDSGSTDRTVAVAEERGVSVLHIESRDFTFGYSLNVGCRNANGQFVAIISAHARPVQRDWLTRMLEPFADGRVAMVYGRHIGSQETKFSECIDFSHLFSASGPSHAPIDGYANNANSAIRRSFWIEHPFDEYLTGLEDIAWARYQREHGREIIYQPDAAVYHIHEETPRQIYNRYRREAIAARRIGLPRPPHGRTSTAGFGRAVLGDLAASLPALSPTRLREIAGFRYQQWKGSADGWHNDVDLHAERYTLFYPDVNQSVVISEPGHAGLQDRPTPEIKPGEVLIKVASVGVCRTDLEIFDGHLGYYKNGAARFPIVPGHEFSGEVVQVGANVTKLKIGDRVVGECILSCGRCDLCRKGTFTACTRRREVGVMNQDGAYSRFVALPAQHVHRIPDQLRFDHACLAEPLAVVHKGIRRISGRFGETGSACAVIGAGPIGNLVAQALRIFGQRVTVFDRAPSRLRHLDSLAETERDIRHLSAFDIVVEATGHAAVLKQVLSDTRSDSTVLLLGFPYGDVAFNFEELVARERMIVGSVGSEAQDFEWALSALSCIDTRPFTEAAFPLAEYARAWDVHRSAEYLKVILHPDERS